MLPSCPDGMLNTPFEMMLVRRAQLLAGETVLITAGPTREKIDPVRYLTNRSSGRMGYALAEAALRRGAQVLLVSGPTAIKPPASAEVTRVESAEEMRQAVLKLLPQASIVIKTAAVADYRPRNASDQKIKRKGPMTLELEPTPDILAELARHSRDEGLQAADTAVRLADSPSILATAASALARLGQRARAAQVVGQALESASAKKRYVCRFLVAGAYADLGETGKALDSLERAYAEGST